MFRDLIELADHLRDAGMSLAAEAQDRKVPAWSEVAYAAIKRIAERQELVHVDDVLAANIPAPAHPNAFGAVWMRLIRDGILERTGTVRRCQDPKKHAHSYPIYRSTAYRRTA